MTLQDSTPHLYPHFLVPSRADEVQKQHRRMTYSRRVDIAREYTTISSHLVQTHTERFGTTASGASETVRVVSTHVVVSHWSAGTPTRLTVPPADKTTTKRVKSDPDAAPARAALSSLDANIPSSRTQAPVPSEKQGTATKMTANKKQGAPNDDDDDDDEGRGGTDRIIVKFHAVHRNGVKSGPKYIVADRHAWSRLSRAQVEATLKKCLAKERGRRIAKRAAGAASSRTLSTTRGTADEGCRVDVGVDDQASVAAAPIPSRPGMELDDDVDEEGAREAWFILK
ncbi:uncharacterized protein PFL1_01565 [Pseudozyma flocculosa PF-1]|uniref:Uncharacterized protein n=1 Tax=Pseudozyma flocculosa TaxID=84751 RepID=A0A5C3EXK4_9BASI|nr:uncharacterized protein PFL1_01565 [Pseudozyma flocculosa PF-1]EPQ30664.1 hypothetical protein PFL1_01565 [Pseudozyma flocculosa PF-1]SPO37003.1 uncharacterized protein PSFLO_02475 [Pseudozyma flocculosa]